MNSPPDPGSPISTDTESPPPEETSPQPSSSGPHFMNIASHLTQSFVGGGAKRRLPGGSGFGASSSNRDPKSRRRGDLQMARSGHVSGSMWEGSKETKREERDLVDHNLVDYLRKEIGDPFQDAVVLKYA